MTVSGDLSSPMRVAANSPGRSASAGISPAQKLSQTSVHEGKLFDVECDGRPLPPRNREEQVAQEDEYDYTNNHDSAEMSLRDISMTEMETLQERYARCERQLSGVREQAKESMAARQRYIQDLSSRLVDESERLSDLRSAQQAKESVIPVSPARNQQDVARANGVQQMLRAEVLRYERNASDHDAESRENLRLVRELFQHSLQMHAQLKTELERASDREEAVKKEKQVLESCLEQARGAKEKLMQELKTACGEIGELERQACENGEKMERKFAEWNEENVRQMEALESKYVEKMTLLSAKGEKRLRKEREERAREISMLLKEKADAFARSETEWLRERAALEHEIAQLKKEGLRLSKRNEELRDRCNERGKENEELKALGEDLNAKLKRRGEELAVARKSATEWRSRVESLQNIGSYGKRAERTNDQFLLMQKQVRDLREELHLHQAVRDISLQEYNLKAVRDACTAAPGIVKTSFHGEHSVNLSPVANCAVVHGVPVVGGNASTSTSAAVPTSPVTSRTNILNAAPELPLRQQPSSSTSYETRGAPAAISGPLPPRSPSKHPYLEEALTYGSTSRNIRSRTDTLDSLKDQLREEENEGTLQGVVRREENLQRRENALEHEVDRMKVGFEARGDGLEFEIRKLREEVHLLKYANLKAEAAEQKFGGGDTDGQAQVQKAQVEAGGGQNEEDVAPAVAAAVDVETGEDVAAAAGPAASKVNKVIGERLSSKDQTDPTGQNLFDRLRAQLASATAELDALRAEEEAPAQGPTAKPNAAVGGRPPSSIPAASTTADSPGPPRIIASTVDIDEIRVDRAAASASKGSNRRSFAPPARLFKSTASSSAKQQSKITIGDPKDIANVDSQQEECNTDRTPSNLTRYAQAAVPTTASFFGSSTQRNEHRAGFSSSSLRPSAPAPSQVLNGADDRTPGVPTLNRGGPPPLASASPATELVSTSRFRANSSPTARPLPTPTSYMFYSSDLPQPPMSSRTPKDHGGCHQVPLQQRRAFTPKGPASKSASKTSRRPLSSRVSSKTGAPPAPSAPLPAQAQVHASAPGVAVAALHRPHGTTHPPPRRNTTSSGARVRGSGSALAAGAASDMVRAGGENVGVDLEQQFLSHSARLIPPKGEENTHHDGGPSAARLRDVLNGEKWKYRVQRQELRRLQDELQLSDDFRRRVERAGSWNSRTSDNNPADVN